MRLFLPQEGSEMQILSKDYRENLAHLKDVLKPGENFDVICREMHIGKDNVAFFYVDGFTKDAILLKLFQYFIGLKEIEKGEHAAEHFATKHIPYIEVEVSRSAEHLVTMVLSGACVMLAEPFGAQAIVIDSRTEVVPFYEKLGYVSDHGGTIHSGVFDCLRMHKDL
jgi:stage V sporulation protein AF